jgi:O-antigen/teichoic acid export membrane protein
VRGGSITSAGSRKPLVIDNHLAGAGYLSGRLLALVALWAVARSLIDLTRSGLLAQQRYEDAARVTVLSALTGACALFAIIQLGELTLGRLLAAHVAGLGFAALLGENFTGAPPLFVLNAVYISLFMLTRPIDSVFHALRKPYLELWHRLVSIPLLIVAAWLLVPQGGALGMVWAHVITGFIALGFAGWLVWRALRRR